MRDQPINVDQRHNETLQATTSVLSNTKEVKRIRKAYLTALSNRIWIWKALEGHGNALALPEVERDHFGHIAVEEHS